MGNKDLLRTDKKEILSVFGKSEGDLLEDVAILKTWIKDQPHLPEVPCDNMIAFLLVGNKFSIEKTKENLDMYYTVPGLLPDFYDNKNPKLPPMQLVSDTCYCVPLPVLTKEHDRVFITKPRDDVDNFDIMAFWGHLINIMEVRLHEDMVIGNVFIFDYTNLTMALLTKYTPTSLKKAATIFEKVFSNRIKGLHFINYPPFINILISLTKSILKPKLANRIYLHTTLDSMYKFVPQKLFPKDYGGEQMTMDELTESWKEKMTEYQERFDKLDKLRVEEKLRPAPLENCEIQGYYGNFKKLDVD